MAQEQQDRPTISFKTVQLLKTQTLGIGSYGSVCKALCDDSLLCAAKIIHPTLIDPNAQLQIERHREHRLPISRFMQECEFMNAMRHPNIVQYLGMHQDPQTDLPVLLMELMDDSLTHFLGSSQDAIPYHIQVNFGHDITLAISYLHSNGIIHRDLSSNNVLLRGNVQAKVTDFGMAKLGDINPQATRISATMCPGTDVYMPPEAVNENPVYTAKIDCFAIGTLIIQILTRCFPKPGVRHKTIRIDHPEFPGGVVDVRVSEVERRQNHISQVDPNHPLLPIALHCLKDSDVDRPSAQELCHRVAALKETPQFTESAEKTLETPKQEDENDTTDREEEIGELRQQVQDKDDENHQLRQEHVQEIQGLQQIIGTQNNRLQEKDDIIREKEEAIEASQEECRHLRETIQGDVISREEEIRELQQQVGDKDEQISQTRQEHTRKLQELQKTIETQKHFLEEKDDIIRKKDKSNVASQEECQHLREMINGRDEEIKKLQQDVRDKDEENRQLRQQHAQKVKELQESQKFHLEKKDDIMREKEEITIASQQESLQLTRVLRDKDKLIQERERQLRNVSQQFESSLQATIEYQTQIQELENQLNSKPQLEWDLVDTQEINDAEAPIITGNGTANDRFKMRWREAKTAPCKMYRGSDAIVDGDTVYFRAAPTRDIYTYNLSEDAWDKLPECETGVCSLVVVNNLLTTIGGKSSNSKVTNKLYSLRESKDGETKEWREVFKSMPTKRSATVAVCTGQALIVAGGLNENGKRLRTVEIMDITTQEWSSASDLPEPLSQASVTVCHEQVYFLGGFIDSGATKSVYTCSLANLMQSRRLKMEERLTKSLSLTRRPRSRSMVWNKIADLPVSGYSCVTLYGQLLTIGGNDSKNTPSPNIYLYHPTSNTWVVISKMRVSRFCCFTAVLPNNEIMVVGGCTSASMFSKTDSVEIATIV